MSLTVHLPLQNKYRCQMRAIWLMTIAGLQFLPLGEVYGSCNPGHPCYRYRVTLTSIAVCSIVQHWIVIFSFGHHCTRSSNLSRKPCLPQIPSIRSSWWDKWMWFDPYCLVIISLQVLRGKIEIWLKFWWLKILVVFHSGHDQRSSPFASNTCSLLVLQYLVV